MKPPMFHTATKQTTSRNAYGDQLPTGTETLVCHFRNITSVVITNTNETIQADALAWFEPDSGVVRQDILSIDDEFWRVDRIIKARRLRDPTVLFIKAHLMRYGAIS